MFGLLLSSPGLPLRGVREKGRSSPMFSLRPLTSAWKAAICLGVEGGWRVEGSCRPAAGSAPSPLEAAHPGPACSCWLPLHQEGPGHPRVEEGGGLEGKEAAEHLREGGTESVSSSPHCKRVPFLLILSLLLLLPLLYSPLSLVVAGWVRAGGMVLSCGA
jgi:hypothetical protein